MSTTSSTPYQWIKKIPTAHLLLDEVPLLGHPPDFPWEDLRNKLSQTFEIQDLKITPSEFQWRSEEDLFEGLGSPLVPVTLSINPLKGRLYWAFSEEDLKKLMSTLIGGVALTSDLLDKETLAAFDKFLSLEVIRTLEELQVDPTLSPQLIQPGELPSGTMLTMDIGVHLQNSQITSRLFLSPNLRESAKEYYTKQSENGFINTALAENTSVIVHLESGEVTLPLAEWSQIKKGDFLLLDKCSLKPDQGKGRVMLTIHGHPFFRGKIVDEGIKILEHPLYYEVNQTMDEEKEYEEEIIDDEETTYDGDDEDIEESMIDEDEGEQDDAGDVEETEESEPIVAETKPVAEQEEKKATKPGDIPVSVVVEIGRVQMSVQTLMDLKPGNLLDLNVTPESSVDLIVNGSRVGKGELLQVGEHLGVRILEMG